MNFEISNEQKQFLEQVDGVCKSIRDYEVQCYLEEKFNDKDYLGISWEKITVGLTSQIASRDKEDIKKCRGSDLNPRTPKGKDFLLPRS